MKLLSTMTFLILLGSKVTVAYDEVINFHSIRSIGYGGNGCPSGSNIGVEFGSNSISFSPDNFQINIDDSEQRLQRSSCNIAIPIYVPPGKRLVVESQKQEGGYYQSANSQLSINQEVFFAGDLGMKYTFRNVPKKDEGDFYSHEVNLRTVIVSDCGVGVNLRINSSITGIISGAGQFIYANKKKIEVGFRLESCH